MLPEFVQAFENSNHISCKHTTYYELQISTEDHTTWPDRPGKENMQANNWKKFKKVTRILLMQIRN